MATFKDTTYRVQTDIIENESEINIENGAMYLNDNKLKIHINNEIKEVTGINLTKTSQLTNDGDNGISHFISLEDLPSNLILYSTNVASGINGYYKLVNSITDPNYNTTAVDIPTGAITTTNQFISGLITTSNLIVGNPGVFNITTIGNITKISGSGTAEFYFKAFKRTSAGVETLVATSSATIPVTNTGYSEFSASGVWNDGVFSSTDTIVLKYYANRISGGSNPSYQFQFGGSTPVRTLVPIPVAVIPLLIIQEYANNAAAIAAGLKGGNLYHTAGNAKVVI